jgi:hypothetical protein
LLSDEIWPALQLAAINGQVYLRVRRADPVPTHTPADDELNNLPASVVNLYRDSLDEKGPDFLRRGPRSFEEQLAFAQQVRPDGHRNAPIASDEDQWRFRLWRDVDWARSFVGPDGIVCSRDLIAEEKPEARIRRLYEHAIGGLGPPSLDELLQRFDLPDPVDALSPETEAKIADLSPSDRQPSAAASMEATHVARDGGEPVQA